MINEMYNTKMILCNNKHNAFHTGMHKITQQVTRNLESKNAVNMSNKYQAVKKNQNVASKRNMSNNLVNC